MLVNLCLFDLGGSTSWLLKSFWYVDKIGVAMREIKTNISQLNSDELLLLCSFEWRAKEGVYVELSSGFQVNDKRKAKRFTLLLRANTTEKDFWHLVVLRKCSFIVTGIPLFQSLTSGVFGPLNPTLLGRVLSGSQQFDSMTKSYLPIGGRYLPSWKGMSHGTWTRNRATIISVHTEVW